MEQIKIIIRDFMSLHPTRIGETNISHFERCVKQHTRRTNHPTKDVIVLSKEGNLYYIIDKNMLLSLLILCLL